MFDNRFMKVALREATKAFKKNEVPVGAVVVSQGNIIAKAHNLTQTKQNVLTHAELLCINKASKKLGNFRLQGCEIYITTEPCLMCLGALIEARIDKIYFGCFQEKMGAFSKHQITTKVPYIGGIMAEESIALLQIFFQQKR